MGALDHALKAFEFLEAIESVGLSVAEIEEAVASDPYVRAEVIRQAGKVQQTWSDVYDEIGPHPYATGRYKSSFTTEYKQERREFSARVWNRTQEAMYLEYGTSRMAEQAPAQKTIELMNGQNSGATSKKSGGGKAGSIGA